MQVMKVAHYLDYLEKEKQPCYWISVTSDSSDILSYSKYHNNVSSVLIIQVTAVSLSLSARVSGTARCFLLELL